MLDDDEDDDYIEHNNDLWAKAKDIFEEESAKIAYYLLGRKIPSVSDEEMLCLWCTSGNAILVSGMYRRAIASRKGIG